ncbi:tenectin-like protein, partial [Euroglyphus maynei]
KFKSETGNKTLVKIITNGDKVTKKPTNKRPKIKPGLIPGEGVCRYEKKVYQNGEKVNSTNPCIEYCMCINSVVYCDEIVCQQDLNKKQNKHCKEIHYKNRCCPRYECHEYDIIEQTDISDFDLPVKTGTKTKQRPVWKPEPITELPIEMTTIIQPELSKIEKPEIITTVGKPETSESTPQSVLEEMVTTILPVAEEHSTMMPDFSVGPSVTNVTLPEEKELIHSTTLPEEEKTTIVTEPTTIETVKPELKETFKPEIPPVQVGLVTTEPSTTDTSSTIAFVESETTLKHE